MGAVVALILLVVVAKGRKGAKPGKTGPRIAGLPAIGHGHGVNVILGTHGMRAPVQVGDGRYGATSGDARTSSSSGTSGFASSAKDVYNTGKDIYEGAQAVAGAAGYDFSISFGGGGDSGGSQAATAEVQGAQEGDYATASDDAGAGAGEDGIA